MAGFDVPLAELGTELFQQSDLLVGELEATLGNRLLLTQPPLVLGHQFVAAPHAPDTTGADLNALKGQLLSDTQAAVARMVEAVVQNGLFNRCLNPVGMSSLGTGQSIDQAIGTEHLVVAANFVKLLAGIAHDFASLAHIGQF
jgi:hypothetical protein